MTGPSCYFPTELHITKLNKQTANEVKALQNIDLHDNKNDNVFIVKPSYLGNKWRHLFRVPTYREWQTSKCTGP